MPPLSSGRGCEAAYGRLPPTFHGGKEDNNLTASDFNHLLILHLRDLPAFSLYWNEALGNCIPDPVPLYLQPSETIPVYQRTITVNLGPCRPTDSILSATSATCEISLTSDTPDFSFDRAVTVDSRSADGRLSSACIRLLVRDADGRCVASLEKVLWSSEPAHVAGLSNYVRLLL